MVAIGGLLALTQSARPPFVFPSGATLVEATTIAAPARIGPLQILRAWRLRSSSRGFGGFSGLLVRGGAVLAISDAGGTARFTVSEASTWRATTRPIAIEGGGGKADVPGSDLEGATGSSAAWWVASEWRNAICRFGNNGRRCAQSPPMAGWPRHFGPEALARLPDGRFLVFEEGDGEGTSHAVLFDRDPTQPGVQATRLRYTPPAGYRTTDAAALPDGRILILHRRLAPLFESRITLLDGVPGAGRTIVPGNVLATIAAGPLRENYEGIAVDEADGNKIWLISDDNFAWYQSTKLLELRLDVKKGSAVTALPFLK